MVDYDHLAGVTRDIELAAVYVNLGLDSLILLSLIGIFTYLVWKLKAFWRLMPKQITISLSILFIVYVCWISRDTYQTVKQKTEYEL